MSSLRHLFPYPNPAANMALGQLLTNDITDKRLLAVMQEVPRALFVPAHLRGAAYVDEDLEISHGRMLIAPLTLARLLDLAEITPSCRVLNIGCLTGYTAAVLGKLAGHVVGIDSDASAIAHANETIRKLGIPDIDLQTVTRMQDGFAQSAPYDVIVISGGVHVIPEALGHQLGTTGRMVTIRSSASNPGTKGGAGKGLRVVRLDHKLQYREYFDTSAPVLPGFERAAGFVF